MLHRQSSRVAARTRDRTVRTILASAFDAARVRAISLDVTGTIMVHAEPIMKTYADSAVWAKLPNPPTEAQLKPAFKSAYKKMHFDYPCFGGPSGLSSRQWWVKTVKLALELCEPPRKYNESEFERFFRRVYQHYGSLDGYSKLQDAEAFLPWASERQILMGITSNTPARTMETVLPMNGYHRFFRWFVCSQDVGAEKPDPAIFDAAFEQARFWIPDIHRDEILHIGDSLASDFCGARAAGFQSLLLDRSGNPHVTQYQDWLSAPDYPGKSEADIAQGTVKDLNAVMELLRPHVVLR